MNFVQGDILDKEIEINKDGFDDIQLIYKSKEKAKSQI